MIGMKQLRLLATLPLAAQPDSQETKLTLLPTRLTPARVPRAVLWALASMASGLCVAVVRRLPLADIYPTGRI